MKSCGVLDVPAGRKINMKMNQVPKLEHYIVEDILVGRMQNEMFALVPGARAG